MSMLSLAALSSAPSVYSSIVFDAFTPLPVPVSLVRLEVILLTGLLIVLEDFRLD